MRWSSNLWLVAVVAFQALPLQTRAEDTVALKDRVRHTLPHPKSVAAVKITADGKTVATVCEDGIIRLFDATTGKLKTTLRGHTAGVHVLAFSSDGKTLVSGGDGVVARVWDVATGKQRRVLPTAMMFLLKDVTISPDGRVIAVLGGPLELWNATAGRPFATTRAPLDHTHSLAFAPKGKLLLSVDGFNPSNIRLWDATNGQLRKTFPGAPMTMITTAAITSDGKKIAYGKSGELLALDVASGKDQSLGKKIGSPASVTFSPDDKVLYAAWGDQLCLWNVETGKQQTAFTLDTEGGQQFFDHCVSISADGKTLAALVSLMGREVKLFNLGK